MSDEFQYSDVVRKLRDQWKHLWSERVNDEWRAEGIATQNYPLLFLDKGTVIRATRDFRIPSFKEVLEAHTKSDAVLCFPPDPLIGGWAKFAKTHIYATDKRRSHKRALSKKSEIKSKARHLKKGGRGWLHK